ncbi:MAG: tetratricopeptide repeat protein [Bryobacteraceae bacterium]|jgi:tetratricopeptide (TPR) repeat protein
MRPLVILFLVASISGGSTRGAEQWLRLTTPHFEMFTTASEKKGREAVLYFETVRQFFIDVGMVKRPMNTPVRIVAFRNEKEYRPYAPNEAAMAFYAGGLDRDFIVMSEIGSERYPAAVHEYVHLIVKHTGLTLPLWMNEGLAEVFSTLRPIGKKVAFGDPIPGRVWEARGSPLLDLPTLISVGHDSRYYNERNRASVFYSESWALMHMLYVSPEYRPKFGGFFSAIAAGEGTEPALRKGFGKSLDEVQKDLFAYIRNERFHFLVASVQLDKNAEDPAVQPIPAWDADLALAEILSSSQRQAETGRKMLERLISEQPQRPEAPAILAELAFRVGHRDEAIGFFAKAAEQGATNPEMYFRYAMLLWNRSGGGDDAILKALRKAVELKPDYTEARMRLGLALMDHGDYKQALEELAHVKSVKQEDGFSYFNAVAYANYRLGDEPNARAALEKAKKWARDPSDRMAAQQLSEALNHRPSGSSEAVGGRVPTVAQTGTAEAVTAPSRLPRMAGTLDILECGGESARLAIVANGRTVWFLVDDPGSVRMVNAGAGSVDFTCGKQAARPVVIEYRDHADSETKTIGVVRGIEFQ